ncbi:MAG: HAMP domain-containing protein [Anaerolineae bacterium]|nr:HAMP domain-containing protein [Anaerolineae bacterium]
MNMAFKFFVSYMLVVLVSIILLAVLTAFVAPSAFLQLSQVEVVQQDGRPFLLLREISSPVLLEYEVRAATNRALLLAGGVATLVSVGISWFMSWRIVRRISEVASASQAIAEGQYDRRLEVRGSDELDELAQNFNRMAQALADTEETRRQLLADISHELKTPLSSIKGYMEALEDGVMEPDEETFHLVYREADRLQRLVYDLQEISRTEAGALEIRPAPNNPAALIEGAVERLLPQFQEKGVRLQRDIPAALPQVCADADRTGQVLLNLLGNALQYTPSDGSVTISAARENGSVQFTVRDTGVGLSPEDRVRVFQRFYRVDKSRARASGGSGIGLTIAKYLVEAQSGRIWAESEGVDRGSAFHFTLPVVDGS